MQRPDPKILDPDNTAEGEPSFAELMHTVTPLKHEYSTPYFPPKKKTRSPAVMARRAAATGQELRRDIHLSDHPARIHPVAGDTKLAYKHINLPQRLFEQLQHGLLPWVDVVDLHQCTVEQARTIVLQFLEVNRGPHQVVVKIVHGKGVEAVLKSHVNGWLRQHPDVLAFCSAPLKHGSTGAVLVLLRKQA